MTATQKFRTALARQLPAFAEFANLPEMTDIDKLASSLAPCLPVIESKVENIDFFRTKKWDDVLQLGTFRMFLFALASSVNPACVIETGVLHGLTSLAILQALKNNGRGTLYSIDLPSYFETGPANKDGFDDTLPPNLKPGWVVGEAYTPFWQLDLGASTDILPTLLPEIAPVDIFLHDSEHTHETMSFEMQAVWPHLAKGGWLVCDNVDCNTAFFDFCRSKNKVPFVFSEEWDAPVRFGIIRKD